MSEHRQITGVAKAFSSKHGWWGILLSTESGDMWVSPGIKSDTPCPAQKGQIVDCTVSGKYNQVVPGNFTVRDRYAGEAVSVQKPQQQKGFKPRNNVGTMTGHATNTAFDLVGYKASVAKLLEAGKHAHDVTVELKAEYAAANPDLSDYDTGATVGLAVRCAANIVREKKKDHSELKEVAQGVLDKLNTAFKEYIEEKINSEIEAAKEEKAKETEQPQEEAEQEVEEKVQDEVKETEAVEEEAQAAPVPADDFDDDVPW